MGVISYKCPNCGGELIFAPALQKYQCEYCASEFSQEQLDLLTPAQGQEYSDSAQSPQEPADAGEAGTSEVQSGSNASQGGAASSSAEDGMLYSCPSCGAQIVTDATTAATICYFCHNPVVLEGRVSGAFLPDQIIPFQLDREKAKQQFLQYIQRKRYVPKDFYDQNQIDKLTGVYYPYWTYQTTVKGSLDAEGTKVRVWRGGDIEYTETTVYHVERLGDIDIENLTRNALQKTDRQLVENVQPFQLSELKPFSMGYLSGFVAERRDMERDRFEEELRRETSGYAKKLLEGTANGYATLRVRDGSYQPSKEIWRYILLPVWVLTYRNRDKLYYFAMNGQTGAVAGKLPVDYRKLALHSGLIGGIVTAVLLILGYFIF